jgi:hypothetical protein
LTIGAGSFGRLGLWRAAVLAAVVFVPAPAVAGQLSASSQIQGAFYPHDPVARPAIDGEVRGWASVEYDRSLRKNLDFSGDFTVYGSNNRRALLDGEAMVIWRGASTAVAGGLLRERWGRVTDSSLDQLGATNTPFSMVEPERRLSQPTIRASALFDGLSVDLYALIGLRRQPLPVSDGRFGFGSETSDVARRGTLGDQALAVRLSGTELDLDWAVHVFGGLNRRPTFVPQFGPDAQLAGVEAIYTEILQIGGELETTRADWRFLSEGFWRRGGLDVTGQERDYGSLTGAAEYQRLGAFGGTYNFIPRLDIMVDTRGDEVDIPFASSVRAGMRIAQTRLLPVQVDAAYSYDWAFRGHAVITAVEKALAESPTLNVGFRFTAFSEGGKPSVLDVWHDDLELYGYVRIELSR